MHNDSRTANAVRTTRAIRNPVFYTLAVQLLVVLPLLVMLLVYSQLWGISFFWGSMVYVLPNLYFTWYAFRFLGTGAAHEITRSFYQGEFGKLALTAAGFALIYRFATSVYAPMLFAGFCVLIVLQW